MLHHASPTCALGHQISPADRHAGRRIRKLRHGSSHLSSPGPEEEPAAVLSSTWLMVLVSS